MGPLDRRTFLKHSLQGIGALSFSPFLKGCQFGSPQIPSRIEQIIFVTLNGGFSHLDSFDYKPNLKKQHGNSIQLHTKHGLINARIIQSAFDFKPHGQSGKYVSSIFPEMAKIVDELTFIHSMHSESPNHIRALALMNTGFGVTGFPSFGGRVVQALGSINKNFPGHFVLLNSSKSLPVNGEHNWRSSQIPPEFNGIVVPSVGTPLSDLKKMAPKELLFERERLALMVEMNQIYNQKNHSTSRLAGRDQLFHLALESQTEILEALDIQKEPASIKKLYGLEQAPTQNIATQLIRARRLIERGVRFVQVYTGGANADDSWDFHEDVAIQKQMARESDLPMAALIKDLKSRGMLEKTLVLFGSEFGRLPTVDSDELNTTQTGRDHNSTAFTLFMAGGGLSPGLSYGQSDDIGLSVAESPVNYHDIRATIFKAMKIGTENFPLDQRDSKLNLMLNNGKVLNSLFS